MGNRMTDNPQREGVSAVQGRWVKVGNGYEVFRPDKCPVKEVLDPACQFKGTSGHSGKCEFLKKFGKLWVCDYPAKDM